MNYFEYLEREADQERRERRDEQEARFCDLRQQRGYFHEGRWMPINSQHQALCDSAGIPKSATWSNFHDYVEDMERIAKGLVEVTHTPEAVASHPSILFLDWIWTWNAERSVFVGRKCLAWERYQKGA